SWRGLWCSSPRSWRCRSEAPTIPALRSKGARLTADFPCTGCQTRQSWSAYSASQPNRCPPSGSAQGRSPKRAVCLLKYLRSKYCLTFVFLRDLFQIICCVDLQELNPRALPACGSRETVPEYPGSAQPGHCPRLLNLILRKHL